MSGSTATPQPTTGKPSIRQQFKPTVSKADTQTQKERQQKEKQATLAVLKKLLETDSQLYGATVKDILAYAANVLEARDELKGNGIPELNFDPWTEFKAKCKGGKAAVSKCIAIAEHAAINDARNIKYLPASLSTLYELTAMSVDTFNACKKSITEQDGTINPAMIRDDARAMAGKKPHPNGTLKRLGKVVVNGEGVEVLNDLQKAAAEMQAKLEDANNEDHLDAAKAIQAKTQAAQDKLDLNHRKAQVLADKANAATEKANAHAKATADKTAKKDDAIETSLTFTNRLADDRFFHFDLAVLKDPAINGVIDSSLHYRLLGVLEKLKTELPMLNGYVWQISLKPEAAETAAA